MGKLIDLTGQRFGRLVVVERAEYYIRANGDRASRWLCRCDCGQTTVVRQTNLKSGHIMSCGCLRAEMTIQRNLKHGKCQTRLYRIWESMKQRCFDADSKNFIRYGGRGIKMCDEWTDFDTFYKWSIENGYSDDLSIDRIDNNGNYEPSNCRWTHAKQQANNRRSSALVTYNGKTQTLHMWADELGIEYKKLWARIHQCKWPLEKAFGTP